MNKERLILFYRAPDSSYVEKTIYDLSKLGIRLVLDTDNFEFYCSNKYSKIIEKYMRSGKDGDTFYRFPTLKGSKYVTI